MGNPFYTNVKVFGNQLLYRGINNEGSEEFKRIKYQPSLFFRSQSDNEYNTLDGIPVKRKKFNSIKEAKYYNEENSDVEGFEVFGYKKYEYMYLHEIFPNKIKFDFNKLKIVNFDIETESGDGFPQPDEALNKIISITLSYKNRYFVFGMYPFTVKNDKHKFILCESEEDLLQKFVKLWNNIKPNIVTGWNIQGFDIPYLVNRISRVIGTDLANQLSPYNYIQPTTINIFNNKINTFDLYGIEILDYLVLYKKFTFKKQENYKLDTIANIELGERKLDFSDYGSLQNLYEKNYELFIEYNIKDVELIDRFEHKLGLIQMVVTTAYDAKINFTDVFYQVKIWENIIYCKLIDNKIVFPANSKKNKETQFRGAYVKESQVGLFDWCASYDVNSLYPSLLVQYNISPETLCGIGSEYSVEELLEKPKLNIPSDKCLAASGYMFSKDRTGFLPSIIEEMLKERFEYKAKQIHYSKILEKVNKRISEFENDILSQNS